MEDEAIEVVCAVVDNIRERCVHQLCFVEDILVILLHEEDLITKLLPLQDSVQMKKEKPVCGN